MSGCAKRWSEDTAPSPKTSLSSKWKCLAAHPKGKRNILLVLMVKRQCKGKGKGSLMYRSCLYVGIFYRRHLKRPGKIDRIHRGGNLKGIVDHKRVPEPGI